MHKRDRWLSTQEVAERLGMSSEWVRRQILAGRMRAVVYQTSGRSIYRVSESALDEFTRRFTRDPGDDPNPT